MSSGSSQRPGCGSRQKPVAALPLMKVLLQNSDGMFWAAPGEWTDYINAAHDFLTRADAAATGRHLQMGVRIYYAFPQPASNFSAPVRGQIVGQMLEMR
jgi:hypothetical protein